MNYGMYLSTGGALTNLFRQDVFANNLANVNTVGFKPDAVYLKQRPAERIESGNSLMTPQKMLEMLGGGQFILPTQTRHGQGDLVQTEMDLDMAIEGEGFFVVSTGDGAGDDEMRFTRDGRFAINGSNELVMSATGMNVLDTNNQPIRIASGAKINIDETGQVFQNDALLVRIQITMPDNLNSLIKAGDNVFRMSGNPREERQDADAKLRQGYIERSGVDPIMALNEMISATKAVTANTKMIKFHDNLMDQAINRLGKIR